MTKYSPYNLILRRGDDTGRVEACSMRLEMTLKIKYDEILDILTIWTGNEIATSSTVEGSESLIVDFGNEDGFDVVGFELLGASGLLAPYFEKVHAKKPTGLTD
jgi:hypothetical protein